MAHSRVAYLVVMIHQVKARLLGAWRISRFSRLQSAPIGSYLPLYRMVVCAQHGISHDFARVKGYDDGYEGAWALVNGAERRRAWR